MTARIFGRIEADVLRFRVEIPVGGSLAVATSAWDIDEVWTSTLLAGALLERDEVEALVVRGLATGGRALEAYCLVADYAAAAHYVRRAPAPGRRQPYLRGEEIVELHALAVRRAAHGRPGVWRATTLGPFPGGMVAPPAWLVPREVASFVERHADGPPPERSPLSWVASAHARFERIHPFANANGRVGRLVANLLLRRLGYPPLSIRPRDAAAYLDALRRADARDPWPLATLFARSAAAAYAGMSAATETADPLVPLRDLVTTRELGAAYKAAARGRLRTVRRGGTVLSRRGWLDAYRATRAPAGRRAT